MNDRIEPGDHVYWLGGKVHWEVVAILPREGRPQAQIKSPMSGRTTHVYLDQLRLHSKGATRRVDATE